MLRLTYCNKYFICNPCSYESRHLPKRAGFMWSAKSNFWYTANHAIASRLQEYTDEPAKKEIARVRLKIEPWGAKAIPFPPNLKPYDFQINCAVPFALSRNRSYLALDPGLGKTICAALIVNALNRPFVYICPPFLIRNVTEEMNKWQVPKLSDPESANRLIIPDSMLMKNDVVKSVKEFLRWHPESILFVDEAHRFKNDAARRTQSLFQLTPLFEKIVFLSGTPMPNRPIELFSILYNSAPEVIDYMTKHQYAMKYCAAHENHFGWDYSGASNMEVLAKKVLGTFMIRLKKEDVLKELPSKVEEMIFIEEKMPARLMRLDRHLLLKYSPEDLMKGEIGEEHISTYRNTLGELKANPVVRYVRFLLDSTDENVLVFAIHKKTIAKLEVLLQEHSPLIITGDVPTDKRHGLVTAFQEETKHRLMILNIQAGGVGFNLTKATRVVFAEFDWVPGNNDQASDRCHRIGQEKLVTVNYLLYPDSIDAVVLNTIFEKRKNQKHI